MKRYKNLFSNLCSFDNLLFAADKARRGKRFNYQVLAFHDQLERNLLFLQKELLDCAYKPGAYKPFWVFDKGKKRYISSAPYRDRVVHHALINILTPIFEPTFIFDSYANRKGKGTHKGIERCQGFCRKNRFVLKCDIAKYFPSIDHEILKSIVRLKIADQDVLGLIDTIIDASNEQEPAYNYFPYDDLFTPFNRRKGIPIGNLTSQFFANLYLNGFDHWVKETVKCAYYVRYVDDFLCFSNDKGFLHELKEQMQSYLNGLRLKLHQKKSRVFPVKLGVEFLGFHVYPYYKKLSKKNSMAFRKKLLLFPRQYRLGKKTISEISASIKAWNAHASYGDTFRLRRKLYSSLRLIGDRF